MLKYMIGGFIVLMSSTLVYGNNELQVLGFDGTRDNKTFDKVKESTKYTKDFEFSLNMMMRCKKEKDPSHCFIMANHCGWHETKFGTVSKKNTFGMIARGRNGKYIDFENWLISYRKYWKNNTCKDMVYKSIYTTTEKQYWINNCNWMFNKFNS